MQIRLGVAAHPHARALQALVAAPDAAVAAVECAYITDHRQDAEQRELRA